MRAWSRLLSLSLVICSTALAVAALLKSAGRRGDAPFITRCPIHGIAYDVDLEVCPECAKVPRAVEC